MKALFAELSTMRTTHFMLYIDFIGSIKCLNGKLIHAIIYLFMYVLELSDNELRWYNKHRIRCVRNPIVVPFQPYRLAKLIGLYGHLLMTGRNYWGSITVFP